MNVAWLSAEPMTQGAMGVTGRLDMVRELMDRGHGVVVVCGGTEADRPFPGIPTHLIPTSYVPFGAWVSQWPKLGRLLDALPDRPRVVVADFALLPPAVWWAGPRGVKVILDVRSQPVEAGRLRTTVQTMRFSSTLRRFAGRVDAITAVSDELLAEAGRRARLPEARRLVWRAGSRWIDDPPPDTGPPPEWPAGLGGRFVVLYHGSLTAGRGVIESVDAMARSRTAAPDLRLVLLGSGAAAEGLRRRAESLGVADRVFVLDPVPHDRVPAFIRSADAGLVPLPPGPTWEVNWPVKLVEYLSLGRPVVLTDIRPHRIVPQGARFAHWCGTGTPAAIERALVEAYRARHRAGEVRAEAGEWARTRFGWREPADAFDALLADVGTTAPRKARAT